MQSFSCTQKLVGGQFSLWHKTKLSVNAGNYSRKRLLELLMICSGEVSASV